MRTYIYRVPGEHWYDFPYMVLTGGAYPHGRIAKITMTLRGARRVARRLNKVTAESTRPAWIEESNDEH